MSRVLVGVPRPRASLLISPLLAIALLWALAGAAAARGIETADSSAPLGPEPLIGYDVSYPQCTGSLPTRVGFAIVGVNGGRVFSPNPCLGRGNGRSQLAWAGEEVEFYANTGNPGPRLSNYWPVGQMHPRPCAREDRDSRDCAYDYGWNAAADSYANAVAAYLSLGWAEPDARHTAAAKRWWLDVEVANSWRSDPSLNVATLRGAVDYLASVGVASVGFYSAPRMWRAITGGTEAFADHPVWLAGATTLREAIRNCRGESFSGGPIVLTQYFANGFDANHRC